MLTRVSAVLFVTATLAACAQPSPRPEQSTASQPTLPAGINGSGREAYERACAHCHEKGLDGAPMTGRASDWAGRSHLWQAVLIDHAARGYFKMPAKGGNASLGDREVQEAAEYMLTLTHPKEPTD